MRRWRRLMGMKQILVMMVAVVLVGQSVAADEKLIADPLIEKAVRENIGKPMGQLTEADLGKIMNLFLTNTQITDAGLKDVAKLQKLEELDLHDTQITDEGIRQLAKLQKLEGLDLSRTKITDAGLKGVTKLKQLGYLDLYNTKVTDAGVAELKKALPDCFIEGP